MTVQGVDQKIIARVQKLLNLARDGGATEAEAATAMERARSIMADHGLEIATVEAAGGQGESRQKGEVKGRAHKPWMVAIMAALAEASFVHAAHAKGWRSKWDGALHPAQWTLIGRQSAVVTVQLMHEYLVRTVDRVARDRGTPTDELFKAAMGERLTERLQERHQEEMRRQREDAERRNREQAARSSHPGAASGGNALVVVLEDYAQKERDLNDDLRRGVPEGTTARERAEQEERAAKHAAERDERIKQREAQMTELMRQHGVSFDVAWDVVVAKMELEDAVAKEKREQEKEAKKTDEQRRREADRDEKWFHDHQERERKKRQRDLERRAHPSYRAGREAGDSVGLDRQVDKRETRKLT